MDEIARSLRMLGHGDVTFDMVGGLFPSLAGKAVAASFGREDDRDAASQLDSGQFRDDVVIGDTMGTSGPSVEDDRGLSL